MELYQKITKETDDNALYTLLGTVPFTNISNLYNRLKKDEIHRLFYSDYLSDEKLNKYFVAELLQNESHIDFNEPISENDYEDLLNSINKGYENSDFITRNIERITDQYLRDGTH